MEQHPPGWPLPTLPVRRRRVALAAALVVIVAFTAVTTIAIADKSPAADDARGPAAMATPALTVETIQPELKTLARSIAASGSVVARDELIVGSDANGVRLVEVLVDVGASVRRGQLLARGDDAALRAQLAQAEAGVRAAEVELAHARANLERAERIKDSGVYSAEAVQQRQTATDAAAARLDLARAQSAELAVHLARTRVAAPADGVIVKKSATLGAVMQPGGELFRLQRDGQLEWLAEVPAASLAQLQATSPARVRLDDGRVIDAPVRLVAPTVDPRTRAGIVHVTLPPDAVRTGRIKAGSFVQGDIVIGNAAVLTLPESAVHQRDGEPFVWLLDATDTARRQRIGTGVRQGGLVEVSGLPAKARVVAAGGGFVKDGERVRAVAAADKPFKATNATSGART